MNTINPSSSTSSVLRKSSPAAKWLARAVGFSPAGASSFRRTALSRIAMLGLASCGWIAPQAMAQDNLVFLKIDGVNGSGGTDRYHAGAMEAFGFTTGVEQPSSKDGFVAPETSLPKPRFNLVTVSKRVDNSSAELFAACATGQRCSNATISVCRADRPGTDFLKITLIGVTIVKVESGARPGTSGGVVFETISLSYTKIQWSSTRTTSDGAPIANVKPSVGYFDLKPGSLY